MKSIVAAALVVAACTGACSSSSPDGMPARQGETAQRSSSPMDGATIDGGWRWNAGDAIYQFLTLAPDGRYFGYHGGDAPPEHGTWAVDGAGHLHLDDAAYDLAVKGSPPNGFEIARAGKHEELMFWGAACDEAPDCVGQVTAPNIELCVKGAVVRTDCIHHACGAHCSNPFLGCFTDADCPPMNRCKPLCPPAPPGQESGCMALGGYCETEIE